MTTNKKVSISSFLIGIVYIIYMFSVPEPELGSVGGFGEGVQMLGFLMSVLPMAIIFGLVGFFAHKQIDTSWKVRLTRTFAWFGISFSVLLVMTILGVMLLTYSRS